MDDIWKRINNDTIAIIGLVALSMTYALTGTGENIVTAITGGLIGYMSGQLK